MPEDNIHAFDQAVERFFDQDKDYKYAIKRNAQNSRGYFGQRHPIPSPAPFPSLSTQHTYNAHAAGVHHTHMHTATLTHSQTLPLKGSLISLFALFLNNAQHTHTCTVPISVLFSFSLSLYLSLPIAHPCFLSRFLVFSVSRSLVLSLTRSCSCSRFLFLSVAPSRSRFSSVFSCFTLSDVHGTQEVEK